MKGILVLLLIFILFSLILTFSRRAQLFVFGKQLSLTTLREDRLHFWGLQLILLLGLLLRIYVTWQWNLTRPEVLMADEPGYHNLAQDLLAGYGFTWPGRVPLYPAWLAAIYLLADGSLRAVRWAQVAWGLLTILLVYALARRTLSPRVGLLAAFLAALSYILIHQSVRLLSESLYTPVLLLAAIALWEAVQKQNAWQFAWAGALIGISNLIRPTLFLFPFFVAVVLFFWLGRRRFWQSAGIYAAASFLVVTPWMVRNYIQYQAVYPLATSNAILWQGSPEYYHLIRHEGYTYLDVWRNVIYGPDGQEHDPGSVEGDRWWTRRALRSIASEPLVYLVFSLEKSVTYWIGDPNADWGDTYIFNYQALRGFGFSHAVSVQYMIARFLPILALAAVFVLWKRRQSLAVLFVFLAYNTILHAATHAEARLSEPLQPFLLILIAGAVIYLVARWAPPSNKAHLA